jgi:hypothetical protein
MCSLYLVWNALPVCPMSLVGSVSISFGRCHFCCICSWMSFHYVLHPKCNFYLSILD